MLARIVGAVTDLSTRLVVTGAGIYASIGAVALAAPEAVPRMFGGRALTPASRTEVRAVYGGLPIAFAVSLARSTRAADRGALSAVATASAGMAIGRLVGCVLEGQLQPWPTGAFLLLETALAGALFAASE
jgi:hypothetical protein